MSSVESPSTANEATPDEPISGKVATILNERELVINAGSDDGVTEGMIFAILNSEGARIVDPDTGEELGAVEIPKALVKTVRVKPRLAVARTFRTIRRNIGGSGSALGLAELFRPSQYIDEPETLRVAEKTYIEQLEESESSVRVGDPVIEVLGDEFDTLLD